MWRIFLFLHIRRSERIRLLLLFSTTLLVAFAFSIGQEFLLSSSSDQRYWIAYLDSLREREQIEMDSIREQVLKSGPYNPNDLTVEQWIGLGLDPGSASRITHYIMAGGRIEKEGDLSRLALGDSSWRSGVVGHLVWERRALEVESSDAPIARRILGAMEVNKPDSLALQSSGLSPYVIHRWKRYLLAGGRIDSLSDLESIYGMDKRWLALNRDQLVYPEPVARQIIAINTISKDDLAAQCECPLWMAERITQYRDKLGGFVNDAQLYELGLDSSSVARLKEWITVEGEVHKVSLNNGSLEELARHPYIGWELARSIEFFRSRVRPIESIEDLVGMEGYDPDKLDLLKYYLLK